MFKHKVIQGYEDLVEKWNWGKSAAKFLLNGTVYLRTFYGLSSLNSHWLDWLETGYGMLNFQQMFFLILSTFAFSLGPDVYILWMGVSVLLNTIRELYNIEISPLSTATMLMNILSVLIPLVNINLYPSKIHSFKYLARCLLMLLPFLPPSPPLVAHSKYQLCLVRKT